MLTAVRLTYRINRFEIRTVVAATILSAVVTVLVLAWMRNSGYDRCLQLGGTVEVSPICFDQQDLGSWMTKIASMSQNLAGFFPILAGLLLGGPVIARELDRGTARLAWSLGPSRPRWYLQRVLPVLLVAVVTAMIIGVVSEQLVSLFAPGTDLTRSFVGFHTRGVLLATGALLVASVAVAVGSVVGRLVPTLLLALILGGATLLAVTAVDQKVLANETVRLTGENQYGNDLIVGEGRLELPDGRLVTWDELVAIDPTVLDQGFDYPYVQFGIPRERYREIETREAVAQVVLAFLFLGAGALVVSRRRPG
jgi:ABC-type transport system involved in multi-copper enzyme maturation permease subunit